MPKSATDVMQEVIVAAVMDAIAGLKLAARGLPNALLRDINAIHPNATLQDLPAEVQAAIAESVKTAFQRLKREGYTVGSGQPAAPSFPPRTPGNRPRPTGAPPTVETKRRPPAGPRRGGPPKPR